MRKNKKNKDKLEKKTIIFGPLIEIIDINNNYVSKQIVA